MAARVSRGGRIHEEVVGPTGILFVALGIQMLGSSGHESAAGDAAGGRDDGDPALVPLGIPLIGGPGAITTVMVLIGQAEDAVQTAVLGAGSGRENHAKTPTVVAQIRIAAMMWSFLMCPAPCLWLQSMRALIDEREAME